MYKEKLLTLDSEIFNNEQINDFYIYGGSHAKCFIRDHIKYPAFTLYNKHKSSASMSGLVRYNSTLKYTEEVDELLYKHPQSFHIFKFGQVDVEYNYYYKILKKGEVLDKEDFFTSTISNYIKYLLDHISRKVTNIVVCGSNITSPFEWESYVKNILKISSIPIGMTYQTKNTDLLKFNEILRRHCIKNGIVYFDLTEECTRTNNEGVFLLDQYRGCDHHYAGAEMVRGYNNMIRGNPEYGFNTHYTFVKKLFQTVQSNF